MSERPKITISTIVNAPVEMVWRCWSEPEHIKKWNSASDDWWTTAAENDLRTGGQFRSRMEAKDGSFGFDFSGIYDEVTLYQTISYSLGDERKVFIRFTQDGKKTKITETFDAESENPLEMQQNGWQSILDHFKNYTEQFYETEHSTRIRIVPHLWYDKEAKEAALFYINLFDHSRLVDTNVLEDTPSGDAEVVSFELAGQPFQAISAGPYFTFNPSISLMVACDTPEEVDSLWNAFSAGGTALMPLDEYPFSKRYGWIQDKYGLSWQLMMTEKGQAVQKITPNFLFTGEVCKKAEEAIRYYTEIFEDSAIHSISRYGKEAGPERETAINYASFQLSGSQFSAMDNAYDEEYTFNEAVSLIVFCHDQKQIDYYWDKLSAVPEAEQCGWLKDKYGVSWQIVPVNLHLFLETDNREKQQRITEAFLKMKKFDLAELQRVHDL